MQIKPKAGRLATGAYSPESPIAGEVFKGNRSTQVSNLPVGRGLKMLDDRTLTVYASPIVNHYDWSTQPKREPLTSFMNVFPVGPDKAPEVQPQSRTKLMHKTQQPSYVRRVFGGSNDQQANTPFHPKARRTSKPEEMVSERNGERLSEVSFASHGNQWGHANNSFLAGHVQTATGVLGRGRWNTIKKGAAD